MGLTVNSGESVLNLFSSFNNANTQNDSSGLSSILSEYNSIKNGSYAKLAKQYYSGKDKSEATKLFNGYEDESSDVSTKLKSDEEIKQNKSLISDVSSFKKAISNVKNDDTLFEKKNVTDADGKEKFDYDYDKIYSKLNNFVKSYNTVLEAGSESNSNTVLRNTLSMTNAVNGSRTSLSSIGITVNSDNTLALDKDAMMKGNMDTAKKLFAGASSFSGQLDTLATNVASQAASDVYSLGGYNSTGAYKQTLESIYNTTI